jgi:hypothetical protein
VAEGQSVFVLAAIYPDPEILGLSDGVHFTELPYPCTSEADQTAPSTLAASDPHDVAVACLGEGGAGSEPKQLYISRDAGHTYQRMPDPPIGGDGAELAMPTPTTVLLGASSGDTQVYRLASPNTSWTTAVVFNDGGIGVSDMGFVDPAHGVLVHGNALAALPDLRDGGLPPGLGTLYLTDDGGADWHLVPIST